MAKKVKVSSKAPEAAGKPLANRGGTSRVDAYSFDMDQPYKSPLDFITKKMARQASEKKEV